MEEIEVKRELSTTGEPIHQICHPSLGQDCTALLNISIRTNGTAHLVCAKTTGTPGATSISKSLYGP